ncbi:hypothetical protein IFR05_002416 [Cadophora sp. M221]|nr:hypothetical protein IFR05_002416 [Cadophora sp. M221]
MLQLPPSKAEGNVIVCDRAITAWRETSATNANTTPSQGRLQNPSTPTKSSEPQVEQAVTPPWPENPPGKPTESPPSAESTVRDRLGYSSISDSNAFVGSAKSVGMPDSDNIAEYLANVAPAWHKYWVLISGLPSPAAVDGLIDIFFSEINWLYGIIEPFYFKRAFREWRVFTAATADSPRIESISPSLRSFPALLAQLLAITMMYLPPGAKIEGLPTIKYLDLSQRYSEIGVDLVRLLGHQGTTTVTVQHDLMRAAWLKNRGHGAEAWHALSKAIRKGQELGLHRHSRTVRQPTGESFWHDEWKKKLWIVLYVWDSNMSLLLGRPRLINASDCEDNLPIDCEFPENSQEMSSPAPRGFGSLNDKIPSSVCLSLFMYNLSHKIHEMRGAGADKPGFHDYATIQRFQSEILSMLEQLPLTIRSPNPDKSWDLQFPIIPRQREKIHTAAYCVLMALHRPHIGRHVESRETVLKAGLAILESQQRFFDSITRVHYAFFGNAFFSVDAIIVLSTTVEIFPWGDVNLLQQLVLATQTALGRLCIIEPQNEMARAAINIVRSCHHTVKEAYGRSMQMNLAPPSMDQDFPLLHDESHYDFSFPTPVSNQGTSSGVYDMAAAAVDQAVFERSAMLVAEAGFADFDDSYWMGYRQMIANDATDGLDKETGR